ncbi:type IX secretion system membrane protein PorP/SprF [Neolewinella aurantiaca]|uniref:Type IX secretion system membrane protein PorP/SprF n=1 Tax=Neolewinella aurantiaca TaxID=2602767 RepID=A0A5C7FUT5_9BACT|nr:PorP/SprF family type IX secretion system membrane protein [Neolewinella aurantiaca]TXF90370.1 type IX secretion system membrane protein PorP/SprF [Neolewinella aurantiaca]
MTFFSTLQRIAFFFVLPLTIAFLTPSLARTQDARYSQIAASPQLTNPAMTGLMNGQLRLTANFRDLYSSQLSNEGFKSYGAGLELRRKAGNGNFVGIGFQLQQDEAGTSDFQRNQGLVSFSYQQDLGRLAGRGTGHFLAGGASVGFGTRGLDINKLWFSNQYFVNDATREAYIDSNLPTGEGVSGSGNSLYLDVNAGLGWFANLGDRRGAYFGLAAYHLNSPDVSPITGNTDPLDQRYVVHGGGELPLGSGDMSLLPAARFMTQGPSYEALFGTNIRYTERNWREVALRAGLWAQMSNQLEDSPGLNAIIVSVGLETEKVQFAVSYDISAGEVGTITNSRGGWELGIIYTQPAKYRSRVICPKF